jgi:hypothetical protein
MPIIGWVRHELYTNNFDLTKLKRNYFWGHAKRRRRRRRRRFNASVLTG